MKKFQILLALLVLSIAFSSCNPNDDNTTNTNNNTNFSENFGAKVDRDFIGQVVDTNNQPIPNVAVKIGTSTVQTDMNGVFIINQANVNERFAYIIAKKAGFIDGSRAMVPTNGKNNVRIMMIPNTPLATIQSGVASEVALPSGTKVVFDGAFETEAGVAYSGSVAVAMFHLAASNENISSLMPGMLYAQATDGSAKVLETFGMMQVELKGNAGQKLQIAKTHTAQINMPIEASQLTTAPNSIPLWHFDEENGYWKQEGSATKLGNKYVGTVSHFSWWNCDAFSSLVSLTVKVVDSNGNPLSNVGVSLKINSTSTNSSVQFTDNIGQVSGLIPTDQSITLTIKNECEEVIYTSQIEPSTSNINLPNIILQDNSQTQSNTINGILTKCDNSKVINGYVIIKYVNNSMIYNVTNGEFSFNLLRCNTNNFTLQGYDLDNLQTSKKLTYSFNPLITNVGFLPTCTTIDEFISFKVNNDQTQYIYGNIDTQNNLGSNFNNVFITNFQIIGVQGQSYIAISGGTNQIGSYSLEDNNFSISFTRVTGNITSTLAFYPHALAIGTAYQHCNLKINKFEAIGGYIDITFSGSGPEQFGEITLVGVAHVRRDY